MFKIKEMIEKYDSIVIYRHIDPDFDAYGSQFGLKHLIEDNYPNKKVYTYGLQAREEDGFIEPLDNPSIDIIRNSLTITTDTSTLARSDDNTFTEGLHSLKIDHHLNSQKMTDYEYVESTSDSCCKIIAKLAIEFGWEISTKAAEYLYAGIISDTQSLSIGSVNSETFIICAFLIDRGVDIVKMNRICFDKDLTKAKAQGYLMNKACFVDDVAYVYSTKEDQQTMNISEERSRDIVDELRKIKGIEKSVVFSQKEDGNYSVSMRSNGPTVVHICQKYGGGGHKLACGANSVTLEQSKEMIELMLQAKE